MSFTLDGRTIPAPTTFKTTQDEITREGRVSSGKKFKDVRATKQVFSLAYDSITETELATLKTEYDLHIFQTFVYPEAGGSGSATVTWKTFPRNLIFLNENNEGIYKNVVVQLEEQ